MRVGSISGGDASDFDVPKKMHLDCTHVRPRPQQCGATVELSWVRFMLEDAD